MNSSLMDKKLTVESYDEYIHKIVNIFRLSSKKNSILFDLEIKDYQATIELSIMNHDGEKQEFSDVIFDCDETFYQSFLIPLIKEIEDTVSIKTKDIVKVSDSSLATFRMITENNDLFTIDGLSKSDAKTLSSFSNKGAETVDVKLIVPNNEGVGSVLTFLFMIGILAIAIILIVVIIG